MRAFSQAVPPVLIKEKDAETKSHLDSEFDVDPHSRAPLTLCLYLDGQDVAVGAIIYPETV